MNKDLINIINDCKPKVKLSDSELNFYTSGLKVLAHIVSKKFLDIPRLRNYKDRFDTDGNFYEILVFDSEQLWSSGNRRMLLAVYQIKDKASWCPLRIDFELVNSENWRLIVYDQSGEHTIPMELIACVGGDWYTQIDGYESITLSGLLAQCVGRGGDR